MYNKRGKAQPLFLVIVLVLVAVVGGVLLFSKKVASSHGKPTIVEAPKTLIPLDEFVVNLADQREPRYLKVEIVIEVRGNKAKDEVTDLKPKIRDGIIQVLSSKYYSELLESSGKERLKAQLKSALNGIMEDSKVVNVYFTSLAMQ